MEDELKLRSDRYSIANERYQAHCLRNVYGIHGEERRKVDLEYAAALKELNEAKAHLEELTGPPPPRPTGNITDLSLLLR